MFCPHKLMCICDNAAFSPTEKVSAESPDNSFNSQCCWYVNSCHTLTSFKYAILPYIDPVKLSRPSVCILNIVHNFYINLHSIILTLNYLLMLIQFKTQSGSFCPACCSCYHLQNSIAPVSTNQTKEFLKVSHLSRLRDNPPPCLWIFSKGVRKFKNTIRGWQYQQWKRFKSAGL